VLLQGLEELLMKKATFKSGDPLKERSLMLANTLSLPQNEFITAKELSSLLTVYFNDTAAMREQELFAGEFCNAMSKSPAHNHSRLFTQVLRDRYLLTINGTLRSDTEYSVPQLVEFLSTRVRKDMFEQDKIDEVWRSNVGQKKRSNESRQDSEALRGGVKKTRPDAAGSSDRDRSPPKPCWVCGRTHGGSTCSWFKHPLKGDKGVVWEMSINGKKAIV
jgi:hypothetical protein